jgi:tripartite-type tricarboxylate transporter receptor subunit TctC
MDLRRRRFLFLTASAAAVPFIAGTAKAQAYPARPVRVIVPFSPGGPTDVFARIVAGNLSRSLGQQFYVENQPGAGGNLGMGAGARATSDGYTIMVVSTSYIVNPSLYPKIPYDPLKDFAPVTLAVATPNVLLVHPSIPASNVKELITFLKANNGKYSYAHSGIGTTSHMSGECSNIRRISISCRCHSAVRRQPSNRRSPVIRRLPSPCSHRRSRKLRKESCAHWR